MTDRSAIITVILTLLLAAAAWFFLSPSSPSFTPPAVPHTPVPKWITNLESAPISSLEVSRGGKRIATIARDPTSNLFLYETPQATERWPIAENHLRAALNILATGIRPGPAFNDPPERTSRPDDVTLDITADSKHTITLSANALGGAISATLDSQSSGATLSPNGDFLKVFNPAAIAAWRSPLAFPADSMTGGGGAGEPAMLRMDALGQTLDLRKRGANWSLTPLNANADNAKVRALFEKLLHLAAQRIIGPSPSDAATKAWTDVPTLHAVIESFFRTASADGRVQRRQLRQELRIGGAADASAATLLAQAAAYWIDPETNQQSLAWGPMLLTLPAPEIKALSLDPLGYLSRNATQLPAADITKIYLGEAPALDVFLADKPPTPPPPDLLAKHSGPWSRIVLARTIDGWQTATQLGVNHPLPQARANQLLNAIRNAEAASVTVIPAAGATPIATIITAGARGTQDVLLIGEAAEAGDPPLLIIRNGSIFYTFRAETAKAVIELLKELVPTEG